MFVFQQNIGDHRAEEYSCAGIGRNDRHPLHTEIDLERTTTSMQPHGASSGGGGGELFILGFVGFIFSLFVRFGRFLNPPGLAISRSPFQRYCCWRCGCRCFCCLFSWSIGTVGKSFSFHSGSALPKSSPGIAANENLKMAQNGKLKLLEVEWVKRFRPGKTVPWGKEGGSVMANSR